MAPGLNGCQNVPKNKRKTRSRVVPESLPSNFPSWDTLPEHLRRGFPIPGPSLEPDRFVPNRPSTSSSSNLVDSENGELSWSINNFLTGISASRQSDIRRSRINRQIRMSADQPSSSQNGAGPSGRPNAPNRQQIVSKLETIQDYIEQTQGIMRELQQSNTPGCKEQHDKLVDMLADLRDSESKLRILLSGMDQVDAKIDKLLYGESKSPTLNGDVSTEEELNRRTEEHNRKVDALEKQRQALLELQQDAQQKLVEAEQERARILARATGLNTEPLSGAAVEANLHSLTERLRHVQRVCEDQNRISVALDHRSMPAEHPDEDQAEGELSDTETDYQLVRDKMAELNTMRAQLSHLQNMMAAIDVEHHNGTEENSRRSLPRDVNKKDALVAGQIQELNRLVEAIKVEDQEDGDAEVPIQNPAQPRLSDVSMETMQQITRDLEEQTAVMKVERDKLIQARNKLQSMAHLVGARNSSSAEDSESEPPSLLPANLAPSPRNLEDEASRSSGRKSNESAGFRAPPRTRQRASWNQSLPTLVNVHPDALDQRRKEGGSSQSSIRNSDRGTRSRPEPCDWTSELVNPAVMFQNQNQLDESAQLCEQMMEESVDGAEASNNGVAGADVTAVVCSQLQALTRIVSNCCKLIRNQQQQINELRSALILDPSSSMQNQQPMPHVQPPINQLGSFAHPTLFQQAPPRTNRPASKLNETTQPYFIGFPGENNRPPPAQSLPNHGIDPFMRDLICDHFSTRPVPDITGYPSNLPNTMPAMPSMPCFSPDEIGPCGALNNQVPPGNRANNYWDNFRSYSRQNLLSTSKSNETADPSRRRRSSRQLANQERTPQAIVPPNNQSQNPVGEVQPFQGSVFTPANFWFNPPLHQFPRPNQRNVDNVKNRTCEVMAQRDDSEGALRNNSRSNTFPAPWPGDHSQDAVEGVAPDHIERWVESRRKPSYNTLTRVRNNTSSRNRPEIHERAAQQERNQEPSLSNNAARSGYWDQLPETSEESLVRNRNNAEREREWERFSDLINCVRNNTRTEQRAVIPEPDLPPEPPERSNNRSQTWNLNNNSDSNNLTSVRLPTTVHQEVSNFIRANEARPNFLIQLFRDLQHVTSDPQRQRALQSLQEIVNLNNIATEERNNIRHENRSNLNRYSSSVDQLFDQLRENQNTIRQNIGNAPLDTAGNNLENPNISNIRELSNSASSNSHSNARHPIEHNEMRYLQSYFEGNLCNAGQGSSLKNPNLSNLRENLTDGRRTEHERMNPKNVYLSLLDNVVDDLRRREADGDFEDMFIVPEVHRPLIYSESVFQPGQLPPRTLEENRDSRRFSIYEQDYRNDPIALDESASGAVRKRGFLYQQPTEVADRVEEPVNKDERVRSYDWPMTMFVRPMSQLGTLGMMQADDADLAEADQSRSAEGSESLCVYVNRLTAEADSEVPGLLPQESHIAEDGEAMSTVEAVEEINANHNENMVAAEGNNNISSPANGVKNRKSETGAKVSKTKLQEAFSAAVDSDTNFHPPPPPSPPLMNMAGALEHLFDYGTTEDENQSFIERINNAHVHENASIAEREAGLDQFPTRLEKTDASNGEKDEPT